MLRRARADLGGRGMGPQPRVHEFGSDALADNLESEAAHKALGFGEIEQIRCLLKPLKVREAQQP